MYENLLSVLLYIVCGWVLHSRMSNEMLHFQIIRIFLLIDPVLPFFGINLINAPFIKNERVANAKSRSFCLYVQDFVILIIRFLLFCILHFDFLLNTKMFQLIIRCFFSRIKFVLATI